MADESGFQTDGFFGIAGYVAEHDVWPPLSRLWNAALNKNGAPYLHMKELSGTRGVYQGWTEEQRRGLLNDCLKIIVAAPLKAFGAVMKVSDFQRLPRDVQKGLVGPYMCCFQEMVLAIGLHEIELFPGDKIDFIYSQQDDFKTQMRRLWDFSKGYREYSRALGRLEFKDMREVPGLQAADLLVYEFRHYYHLRATRPDLDLRVPFRTILTDQVRSHQKMLKYLPGWLIEFQAKGVAEEAMRVISSDRAKWGNLLKELHPPMMDLFEDTSMMRTMEKYRAYSGKTIGSMKEILDGLLQPDPIPDYEEFRPMKVTVEFRGRRETWES